MSGGARHGIPLVLGHRGYRARFPENTALAFREALARGADGVECDVQRTADGRYVIIHDPTTERVTGVGGEVARMTLAELRELDFGAGERIPVLEDLLSWLPSGAYLDLELKAETISQGDCGKIEGTLDAGIDRRHLMISSFEPALLIPFRRKGFTVGLLVGEAAASRGPAAFAATLLRLRPQYVGLPAEAVSALGAGRARAVLGLLRLLGCSLLFWDVTSADQAAALARCARIIVTDEVELIVRALRPG